MVITSPVCYVSIVSHATEELKLCVLQVLHWGVVVWLGGKMVQVLLVQLSLVQVLLVQVFLVQVLHDSIEGLSSG